MATVITEGKTYLDEAKTKMLCEKWNTRISFMEKSLNESASKTGISFNYERKAALSKLLENTQNYIKGYLGEAVPCSVSYLAT
jgi:hypothetical protein